MKNYFNTPTYTTNPLVGHSIQVYAKCEKPKGHIKWWKLEIPGHPGQILGYGRGGDVACGAPNTLEMRGARYEGEIGNKT
jgi:hypothetical protein